MLWAEGGLIGWFALLVNVAGFALTGDLTWAILLPLINRLHVSTTGLSVETLAVAQVFPAPLILLIMGIFYLWAYARAGSHSAVKPAKVDNSAPEFMTSRKTPTTEMCRGCTMREKIVSKLTLVGLCVSLMGLGSVPALAQGKVLEAIFTADPIKIDGNAEAAWNKAPAANIAICMNTALTAQLDNCKASGTVQALWNGPLLYLLFTVTDPDSGTTSATDTKRSSVQIYVDQDDDKFPKFEEDDGYVLISAAGQQTGNRTNAGLPYYPAIWSTHLQSYAAAIRYDSSGNKIGCTIEVAWSIGDLPLKNGTKLGMEFAINALSSTTNASPYQLYWSSGNNKGANDNSMWGDVVLAGYDGVAPMQLNTFMLQENIRKASPSSSSATGLVRGIWKDESAVDHALDKARKALRTATTQAAIDSANTALDTALRGLRRSGKYPDPQDLPSVKTLPDPFTFFNGKKVRSKADWDKRRAEIKDLAQYYEFGYMPRPPQSLTAESTPGPAGTPKYNTITVTVQDGGKSASFKPILYLPTTGNPPYPVVVEEDFAASQKYAPPNPAFIQGGYAVLSIPASDNPRFGVTGVASDDGNHTGAFFTLYPYQLDPAGNDRGVLLAWAAAWTHWNIWLRMIPVMRIFSMSTSWWSPGSPAGVKRPCSPDFWMIDSW